MWWMLAGCPWISLTEHDRGHARLEALLDADADTDADSDTDVDTDADTDTDPGPCVEDSYEPNDSLLTPTDVAAPAVLEAAVCPENVSPVFGIPLDLYAVELGPLEVLDVAIGSSGVPCDQLQLGLEVTDDAGAPFPEAAAQGGCPSLQVGWSADSYLVWVTGGATTLPQPYQLEITSHTCRDNDGDQFLAATCGGPDCSDLEPDRYPGAIDVPLDGTDQDCDGGDDLQSGCAVVLAGGTVQGTLPCGDLETGAVWDRWQVPAPEDEDYGLSVVVQNEAGGAADLVALVVDADGSTHYGLEADRSELDDELDCASPAWTGATEACPGACVWSPTRGAPVDIWVAQHPGAGCVAGAGYSLLVYRDGVGTAGIPDVDDLLTQAGDDVVVGF